MANTRARSYNTLTYNGGKHILNSKLAMKKRLLNKYKVPQPIKVPELDPEMDGIKKQPTEDKMEEVIDVETVSDSDPQVNLSFSSDVEQLSDTRLDERTYLSTPGNNGSKPSLEQVVAMCRQKTDKTLAPSCRPALLPNKSVIENLRAVVNSVSPTDIEKQNIGRLSPEETSTCGSPDHNSPKRFLSPYAKTILNEWFRKHLYRPYPTYEEKKELARLCGISSSKVDTWFANKRNRTHNTKKLPPKYSHLLSAPTLNHDEV